MAGWIVVFFVLAVIGWAVVQRLGWIKIPDAAAKLRSGAILVDVRTPSEYRMSKVDGAYNVPLGEFSQTVETKGWSKDQQIVVYCASGNRSRAAIRQLTALGYPHVWNLGTVGRARQAAAELGGQDRATP